MNMTPRPDPFSAAVAALDPAPAAAILRQMALSALADALGSVAPYPINSEKHELGAWLTQMPVNGAGVIASLRQLQRALLFGQINDTAPVSRALVAAALPAGRIARLRDRVAGWRGRYTSAESPPGIDAFGTALAALAFSDATFRRGVITMIRDHLGARVLFHPDIAPVPILSAPCWMILIAARTDLTDQTDVTIGVRALADTLSATAGWAGFWDQWLLAQAAGKSTFALPKAIRALPLLANGYGAIKAPADQIDPMVAPDWLGGVPGYCQDLFVDLS